MMNDKVQEDLLSIIDNFISSKDSNKKREDFKSLIITLTEASMYEEQGNKKSMVKSNIEVFSGDTLKDIYSSLIHFKKLPKSVDAIFKFVNNEIYLIEFKSGSLKENKQEHVVEIYKKAYDTLLLFLEMQIIKSIKESIQNIIYILVYDHSKYVNNDSRNKMHDSLKKRSKKEDIKKYYVLQIGSLKESVFKDAYAVDREDFKSEILPELEAEK